MKSLKDKRGFTLVELLVAITILGIIMVIALPQISNIQTNNKTTKYKKYAESMVSSAKLYTDSYTEDMFGNNKSGCVDVSYDEMKDKDLLKDIKVDGSSCKSSDTYIRVRKANDHYFYETSIYCVDKNGKVIYDERLNKNACNGDEPDTVGPTITISPTGSDWTKGTNETVTVKIWDEYGMLENAKVKLVWEKDNVAYETKEYSFKNKRYEGESEANALTYTFKVPQNETGIFKLTVVPVDVRDSLGNYQTSNTESGDFKLDNTPPSVPTIYMYKWTNNSTTPTTSTGLSTYTNGTWSNKNVFTKASGSLDLHAGGVYYRYTTTGATTNNANVQANYRNVEAQGTSTIAWQACDKLGNCSSYATASTIKLDKTKPNAPTVALVKGDWTELSNDTWYNHNVYVSGSTSSSSARPTATDAGEAAYKSGISYYQISTDNSTWVTWSYNSTSDTYRISSEGITYRYVRAVDNAGNVSSVTTKTIKIDKTAPSVPTVNMYKWTDNSTRPTSTSGLSAYTNNTWSAVSVYTTASGSSDSGADGVYYQYTTTGTTTNATNATASVRSVEAGGISYIKYRACDSLGNCSDYSDTKTIKLDKTAPTISSITNPSGGNASLGNFSLTLNGSDTQSGIAYWQYKYASTNWTTYANSASNSFVTTAFTAKGNELVYVRACDNVGNCSGSSSTTIHIVGACDSGYTQIGSYGDWGSCSASCGPGTKYRDVYLVSSLNTSISCGKRSTQESADCNNGTCEHTCETGGYITAKSATYVNYICTKMTSDTTWSGCSCGNSHTAKAGYYMCQGQCIYCAKKYSFKWCIKDYWRAGVSAG